MIGSVAWRVDRINEPSPEQTRVTRLVLDRSTCLEESTEGENLQALLKLSK